MRIGEGIEMVGDATYGSVRAFLVVDADGKLTLIDTLGEKHPFMILDAVRRLGFAITDLERIFLTHAHFSHLAGLVALVAMSDAKVFVHEEEADMVRLLREAERVPLLPRRPYRAYYPFQLGCAIGVGTSGIGRTRFDGFAVDPANYLDEGKQPRSRIAVVHAPGHTRGHLAFSIEDEGVLLAGDAVVTWPYEAGGWDSFTLDRIEQRETLTKLADLAPELVGVGHGDPIAGNAKRRLQRLADQAPKA